MRIEPGSPTDAGTLARLNPFVHDLHREHAPHVFGAPTHEEAAAAFEAMLRRDNHRAFLAYVDDRAVGYVLVTVGERPASAFNRPRRWLYIDQISIEPAARRRGVGRALVAAVLEYADDTEIHDVEVDTWAFNDRAQAFFASLGFRAKTRRSWITLRRGDG
jgi:ribosomal protein S18 acetylase RimI-like enzyme